MAIKRMNINFDNQLNLNGDVIEINGDVYIEIMSKILAKVRYDSYQNIKTMAKTTRSCFWILFGLMSFDQILVALLKDSYQFLCA